MTTARRATRFSSRPLQLARVCSSFSPQLPSSLSCVSTGGATTLTGTLTMTTTTTMRRRWRRSRCARHRWRRYRRRSSRARRTTASTSPSLSISTLRYRIDRRSVRSTRSRQSAPPVFSRPRRLRRRCSARCRRHKTCNNNNSSSSNNNNTHHHNRRRRVNMARRRLAALRPPQCPVLSRRKCTARRSARSVVLRLSQ